MNLTNVHPNSEGMTIAPFMGKSEGMSDLAWGARELCGVGVIRASGLSPSGFDSHPTPHKSGTRPGSPDRDCTPEHRPCPSWQSLN